MLKRVRNHVRAAVDDLIAKARAEASLRDEVGRYLVGEWRDQLTDALHFEVKRWVIAAAIAGGGVGAALGYAVAQLMP